MRQRLHDLRARWRNALTLGVRGLVMSADKQVFLVEHSYVPGWHLPGGGVERGESFAAALARELKEEGNIDLTDAPVLHGLYFHPRYSVRDHVALFIVRGFRQETAPAANREIIASGFFPIAHLPAGTTVATRARIAEVANGLPPADFW